MSARRLVILLSLLALAAPVFSSPPASPGELGAMAGVKATINQLFDTANAMVAKNPLEAQGKKLFWLLTTILIAWTGIKVVLEESGFNGWISQTVRVLMLVGFTAWFMQTETLSSLAGGFTEVATAVSAGAGAAGGAAAAATPADQVLEILENGGNTIMKIWSGPVETVAPESDKSWWQSMIDKVSLGALVGGLTEVLSKLLISLAVVLALAFYVAILIASQWMLNIALILSPIFIPWLLVEQTAFLFHGWVKFLIVAGMQKVVGALLLGLTGSLLTSISTLANTAGASPAYGALSYMLCALIAGVMAFLMLQVPSIAAGLVSGLPSTALPLRMPRPPMPKPSSTPTATKK